MKKIILNGVLNLLAFLTVYVLSKCFWGDIYLFEWTSRHSYCYLWLIVIALVIFKKYIVAISITSGNIVGIVAGQWIGDAIRENNMKKIVDGMSNGERYYLMLHQGVFIWIITILIFIISGCIIERYRKLEKNVGISKKIK